MFTPFALTVLRLILAFVQWLDVLLAIRADDMPVLVFAIGYKKSKFVLILEYRSFDSQYSYSTLTVSCFRLNARQ